MTTRKLWPPQSRTESNARIPVDVYLAACDKLADINPTFDRATIPTLDLDEHGVQRGTLLFTYDRSDVVVPDAATPVSVVDAHGTTVNGRATMVSGDATDSDVLVAASGFMGTWADDGDLLSFPDLYPFGRGGRGEPRPVDMSGQSHASLMLRCWDRRAARNQPWTLLEYDRDVRKKATGKAIGVAHRRAGARPEDATALTVSRVELDSAAKHHDAKLAAVKRGDRMPDRPQGLSTAAEQMLRSVRQSTDTMPGTVEFALNKRNEFWALAVYFGLFAVWNTFSPNDAKTSDIADISATGFDGTPSGHDGTPAKILAINAADPGACAMYYNETVAVFIKHILGWDSSKQAAVAGGGVFGVVSCFAGMTEAQKRLSMHLHSLIGLAGLPSTSAGPATIFVDQLKRARLARPRQGDAKPGAPLPHPGVHQRWRPRPHVLPARRVFGAHAPPPARRRVASARRLPQDHQADEVGPPKNCAVSAVRRLPNGAVARARLGSRSLRRQCPIVLPRRQHPVVGVSNRHGSAAAGATRTHRPGLPPVVLRQRRRAGQADAAGHRRARTHAGPPSRLLQD